MKFISVVLLNILTLTAAAFAADSVTMRSDSAVGVAQYGTVDYKWAKKVLSAHGLVPVKVVVPVDGKPVELDRVISGYGATITKGASLSTDPSKKIDFNYYYGALAAKKPGDSDQQGGYLFFNISVSNSVAAKMLKKVTTVNVKVDTKSTFESFGVTDGLALTGRVNSSMGATSIENILAIPQTKIDTRVFSERDSNGRQVEYVYRFDYTGPNGTESNNLYVRPYNESLGDTLSMNMAGSSWKKYFKDSGFQPGNWVFTDAKVFTEYLGLKKIH